MSTPNPKLNKSRGPATNLKHAQGVAKEITMKNAILYSKSPNAPGPQHIWNREGEPGTGFIRFLTGITIEHKDEDDLHTILIQMRVPRRRKAIRKAFAASRWDLVKLEPYQFASSVRDIQKMPGSFTAGLAPTQVGGHRFVSVPISGKPRKHEMSDDDDDFGDDRHRSVEPPRKMPKKIQKVPNPKFFNKPEDDDEATESEPERMNAEDSEDEPEDPEWAM